MAEPRQSTGTPISAATEVLRVLSRFERGVTAARVSRHLLADGFAWPGRTRGTPYATYDRVHGVLTRLEQQGTVQRFRRPLEREWLWRLAP